MDFASSGNVWSILYGGDDVASLYGDIPPPSNILRSLRVLLVLFHRAHFLVRQLAGMSGSEVIDKTFGSSGLQDSLPWEQMIGLFGLVEVVKRIKVALFAGRVVVVVVVAEVEMSSNLERYVRRC